MKRFYFLALAILCTSSVAFAQTQGCDGTRYIEDVFEEIQITPSIIYGENVNVSGNDQNLAMDIYEPMGDELEKRPLIIFAHGGSFIFGARQDMAEQCELMARKGYVAVTIDYRRWPLVFGIPDSLSMLNVVVQAVHDMKGAVRFMREDAATDNIFRIDPDNIFVGGLSAGAVMACQVGMMDVQDDIPPYILDLIENNGGIEGTTGSPDYSSDVQGIVNLSGGLYQSDWADSDDPPILSMHGTNDDTVPYEHGLAAGIMSLNGSGNIHPFAEAAGIENFLITVPGGGHTDIYFDAAYAEYQEIFLTEGMEFLEGILCANVNSTEELVSERSVDVYPNPASDFTNLTIVEGNYSATYDVQIFDHLGRLVYTQFNNSDATMQINQHAVGKGMFVVQVRFEDSLVPVTKKLIFE